MTTNEKIISVKTFTFYIKDRFAKLSLVTSKNKVVEWRVNSFSKKGSLVQNKFRVMDHMYKFFFRESENK